MIVFLQAAGEVYQVVVSKGYRRHNILSKAVYNLGCTAESLELGFVQHRLLMLSSTRREQAWSVVLYVYDASDDEWSVKKHIVWLDFIDIRLKSMNIIYDVTATGPRAEEAKQLLQPTVRFFFNCTRAIRGLPRALSFLFPLFPLFSSSSLASKKL
jgi:hypothetical protein